MHGQSPLHLMLGKGILYFDRFDANGLRTGEVDLGNCESFTLGTADTKVTKYSSRDAAAGVLREVTIRRDVTCKITGNDFNQFNASLFLMGDEAELTQAAATVTAEAVTATPKKGRWYSLANRSVTGVEVKQGSTALEVETDYSIDSVRGRIYIRPESTAFVEDTPITADYTADEVKLPTVRGSTQGNIEGFLRFVGDPTSGPITEVEVWRVSIQPEGESGYISDDWGNWQLTLKVLKDETRPDNPWYHQIEHGNR